MIALIIFIVVYIGIIFDKLPFVNLDRKSIAFVGVVAMVLCGCLSPQNAIKSIDFNTLALLLGMMLIISNLKLDGFFSLLSQKTIFFAKTPFTLLIIITFITGFASAFLVNDAVVLLFTPVIIEICRKINLSPIPFLLGEMFSANAGSLMTITGNPQNMIIGIASGISYSQFILYLLPIAIISMLIIMMVIKIFYKDIFGKKQRIILSDNSTTEVKNIRISLIIFCLVIVGFFFGKLFNLSIPMIALIGGGLTLIFSKHKTEQIFKGVDWSLLLFFASLFVLVASIKNSVFLSPIFDLNLSENTFSILVIFVVSIVLSQILSNVPYTILILPLLKLANSNILWLALATSSTLAGNFTIFGAMANLIVLEQAQKLGVTINNKQFYPPALIISLLTILVAFGIIVVYTKL